jgi:flagellar basal-body rod protein FlgG
VTLNPFGSDDEAPIIGKLGLGVETNELYTEFTQGGLKQTGSNYDMALKGQGFLCVETPQGERYTRNGNFTLGKEGYLETKDGYPVMGEKGPIKVQQNNFRIDQDGVIYINPYYVANPKEAIGDTENQWQSQQVLDKLKLVNFTDVNDGERYIQKQGNSLYKATDNSGDAVELEGKARPQVMQGFLETSNVEPVSEMVKMIEVQRAYEANEKAVENADTMLGTLINQVARYNG